MCLGWTSCSRRPSAAVGSFTASQTLFFCSILLICDRLSVHGRAIFKFSFPMTPPRRTSAFLKVRKALKQPRVSRGALSSALYHGTCIYSHPPLGPELQFALFQHSWRNKAMCPCRCFKNGCLSSFICISDKRVPFVITRFLSDVLFGAIELCTKSMCLPVYNDLFEGRGSVTCGWGYT